MSTQTAVDEVSRGPLSHPFQSAVLAVWAAAGIVVFALAWLVGWATAGERSEPKRAVPIAQQQAVVTPPALEAATPLPALRPAPVRPRPRRRERTPQRPPVPAPVVSPPPAPRTPPPVVRRPVAPPAPAPVVIVGKG